MSDDKVLGSTGTSRQWASWTWSCRHGNSGYFKELTTKNSFAGIHLKNRAPFYRRQSQVDTQAIYSSTGMQLLEHTLCLLISKEAPCKVMSLLHVIRSWRTGLDLGTKFVHNSPRIRQQAATKLSEENYKNMQAVAPCHLCRDKPMELSSDVAVEVALVIFSLPCLVFVSGGLCQFQD